MLQKIGKQPPLKLKSVFYSFSRQQQGHAKGHEGLARAGTWPRLALGPGWPLARACPWPGWAQKGINRKISNILTKYN